MDWDLAARLEAATPADPARDYCLWPYERLAPVTPTTLRTSAILYHSFAVAGLPARMLQLCDALQTAAGPFNTVWGIKWDGKQLSWEFYFYDYTRMQRAFDTAGFVRATQGLLTVTAPPSDGLAYFMFSVEVTAENLAAKPVDQIDIYIGNPGSEVSSGICYGSTARGMELRNFYFFFDAKKHHQDIRTKIVSNAHIPLRDLRINEVIWPEMTPVQTIVIANKRLNDGLYFSRIPVDRMAHFMARLAFPAPMQQFISKNAAAFAPYLFDVGYDYRLGAGGKLDLLKGGIYGLL